ncbi:S1 family peptidase [Polyangium jinanense]|uniref:Trypsin-like peptidase domain-containing protein n=1 Tax=Polyangium jinanense TaxID=2829994 RepID=A0A9X3X6C1_9BACT|nr:serine protease [Polyangium jinanense]MDC3984584.1 trypsin-like peptidase domain-containing protein [Polyangium jinanense]
MALPDMAKAACTLTNAHQVELGDVTMLSVGLHDWQNAVERVTPHVVKIATPQGWGSGFLLTRMGTTELVGIATAAHVIDHAHDWQEPIRIYHQYSGTSELLHHDQRAITIAEDQDAAAILFVNKSLRLPEKPLDLVPEGNWLRIGNEVGWLGYPGIAEDTMCFFSGRVSAFDGKKKTYLIDGVAINGVSGGPTFLVANDLVRIIGTVTAYQYNRTVGQALPGLSIVTDVSHLQQTISQLRSMEEAQRKESDPQPPGIEGAT